MANARKEARGAESARALQKSSNSSAGITRMSDISSTSEAVDWWQDLLREWDIMPNEAPPIIKHPAYVAESLYSQVYEPEMLLYSSMPPLRQKDGKAPGSWFRARDAAVHALSVKEFGLKEGTTSGEPSKSFKLLEFPNHSNFAECNDCRNNRKEKETNIAQRASRATRDATSAKQVAHITDCHAERTVTAEWVREANRASNSIAELDDKLGSWWNFLPMPQNMRFGKVTNSKWRYHQCLQANLFPGYGNFFSFVPPFLTTGNNFGCTCFCISLCRLIKTEKLPLTITDASRQTDGGSDNDGKTTHGLHYVLIREGTFNSLLWGKLRAGHSHNRADLAFSDVKAIFYPRNGVGPGCASPLQYHAALVDGLKQMAGGLEIMWQLANFDFDAFVSSFVDRAGFTHASDERLWHYEYAPELTDVFVRCTFKAQLNDVATSTKAAWRPRLPPNAAGWQRTDPQGLIFLKKDSTGRYEQPDFEDPGLEKWVEGTDTDESGWSREKVFKDIRDYAVAEKFTDAQKQEWEALFDFHLQHETPDSLAFAPHVLSTRGGASITMHGMPISWYDMWETLRRLPRAHLTAVTAVASQTLPSAVASTSYIQKGLAHENSVTGTNYPKRDREKQVEEFKMRSAVSELPRAASTLQKGQLYFIALLDFEGEMAVGIGRTSKLFYEDKNVNQAEVEWLTRRGWSPNPKERGYMWAASPMFDAYMPTGKIEKNTHPIGDFLPTVSMLNVQEDQTILKTRVWQIRVSGFVSLQNAWIACVNSANRFVLNSSRSLAS